MISELTDTLKSKKSHLLREKAYNAIGQTFIELEAKHLGTDIKEAKSAEEYYLRFLEAPKGQLLKQLNKIEHKLRLKNQKQDQEQDFAEPLIGKNEFIGQDEYVVTHASSFDDDITVIPNPEYTSKDLGCK
jgi:hypothetical protein